MLDQIAESWGWAGLDPAEIVGRNAFGNFLVRDTGGAVWRICPEELSCEVIADNDAELAKMLADPGFQDDWEMAALEASARRTHGPLEQGYCYMLVTPAVLGGAYDAANIRPAPIEEVVGLWGEVAEQIDDLPDGAKVRIEITD